MKISSKSWENYIAQLSKLSSISGSKMKAYLEKHGIPEDGAQRKALIDYANSLSWNYGDAAATLACQMYDEIAIRSKVNVPPAEPADAASYQEVARAMNGVMKQTDDYGYISSVVGRLVKQAAADTTLQNAHRDHAEFAWIPHGDTCAFCIALASRGWREVGGMKDGHAEHIHANCDCEYAIRFNNDTEYESYDPSVYEDIYYDADTSSYGLHDGHWQSMSTARINGIRRAQYADKIIV